MEKSRTTVMRGSSSAPTSGRDRHLLRRSSLALPPVNAPSQWGSNTAMKSYTCDDITKMSPMERDSWLNERCSCFDREVGLFLTDRDAFVDELYRKLKLITKRWSSWNHRSFGAVNSRGFVKELLAWEKDNQVRHALHSAKDGTAQQQLSPDLHHPSNGNPLERFELLCQKSATMLARFRRDVYQPLKEFFVSDDNAIATGKISKSLERCLQKWDELANPIVINERLFSKASEKDVFHNGLRNRTCEFDVVLRLIPDLLEKKRESIRLSRRWLLASKSSLYQRRGTYTIDAEKLLPLRWDAPGSPDRSHDASADETHSVTSGDSNLHIELRLSQSKYKHTLIECNAAKEKCLAYELELHVFKRQVDSLEIDLRQTKEMCRDLDKRLQDADEHNNGMGDELTSSQEYCRVLQRELETAKMRYCTQKIKFMNARKRMEMLNVQLERTQEKHKHLEKELDATRERCQKLYDTLDATRRNVHTQGTMIDALQHQCYTLKQDLDQSNVKKGELYTQLEEVQQKCKATENELTSTKERCSTLESSLRRSKTREGELDRENTELKQQLCKQDPDGEGTPRRDCIFPDIKSKGRSS